MKWLRGSDLARGPYFEDLCNKRFTLYRRLNDSLVAHFTGYGAPETCTHGFQIFENGSYPCSGQSVWRKILMCPLSDQQFQIFCMLQL